MTDNAPQPPPQDSRPPADTGLPEEFELTPELVEEEAIRGDFVLRWAVVLLAFLVGFTTISTTETLVRIKTGEHLLTNGIVPDGTDPFAYTTEGRVWRNQAWLFDLILGGVYRVGGDVGLTIFKALLTAATFWLVVRLSRPQTPTWWNAIVAAIGAVACAPFLSATPEIITLAGCALTLTLLHAWRHSGREAINRKLPVLFLFWANLDPRMFLGLALILVFAIGESFRRRERPDAPRFAPRTLWSTVGVCFAATLVNPFGWHAWLAPYELYTSIDPLFRELNARIVTLEPAARFNLSHEIWWKTLTIPFLAALVIGGLAVIALYLNFSKLALADALLVAAFGGFAWLTAREIGPAVVVMCIIVNLNCQDWYRDSFSQAYSVRKGELLFSRGGRAVTVLALVGLAWLTMKGNLFRGYLDTVGFGFEPQFADTLTALEDDLKDQFDNRPFNFTAAQGDTLIWVGQQVFLDSRLALFRGEGDADLIKLHDNTRWAMRRADPKDERTGKPDVWKKTFETYGITHAIPRLARLGGFAPDYDTYTMLMLGGEFQLTQLGPSTAVYYRRDVEDPKLREYLRNHQINFVEQAFRSEQPELGLRVGFPQPKDAYAKYLRDDRVEIPKDVALATHYIQHLEYAVNRQYRIDARTELAFAYLTIRNCHRALATEKDFDNPIAFRLLGQAYRFLLLIESNACNSTGAPYDPTFRYYEAMLAFRQSLVGQPDHPITLLQLRELYLQHQRLDLALDMAGRLDALDPEGDSAEARQNREIIKQLDAQLKPVREQVEKLLAEKKADEFSVTQYLMQNRLYQMALEYLDRAPGSRDRQSPAYLMRASLLLENGQLESAFEPMLELEQLSRQEGRPEGLRQASWVFLGSGDFTTAIATWKKERELVEFFPLKQMLDTAPLVADEQPLNDDAESWHLGRYVNFIRALSAHTETQASLYWMQAMAHLEAGENDKAQAALETLLRVAPETQMRPFIAFYLYAMADIAIDPVSPSERIPITADMFAAGLEPTTPSPESKPEE